MQAMTVAYHCKNQVEAPVVFSSKFCSPSDFHIPILSLRNACSVQHQGLVSTLRRSVQRRISADRLPFFCDGKDDCGDNSDEPEECRKHDTGFVKQYCAFVLQHTLTSHSRFDCYWVSLLHRIYIVWPD